MRHALALASGLLLAACSTSTFPEIRPLPVQKTAAASPFDDAYQKGKNHLLADRFGLAIVAFEKALRIDPVSVAALNALGAAYDELRRPEVAKTYYFKALAIEPNSADTMNNIAISASLVGDEPAARQWFSRAVALDPHNSVIFDNARRADGETVAALPDEPVVDDLRPRIERTGFEEVTLTLPATVIEVRSLPPATMRPVAALVVTAPPGATAKDEFDAFLRSISAPEAVEPPTMQPSRQVGPKGMIKSGLLEDQFEAFLLSQGIDING